MTCFENRNKLDAHYLELEGKGSFIEKAIDEKVGIVYDEFKGLIEGLTCCNSIGAPILDREARFMYALADLKSLVWEKCKSGSSYVGKHI